MLIKRSKIESLGKTERSIASCKKELLVFVDDGLDLDITAIVWDENDCRKLWGEKGFGIHFNLSFKETLELDRVLKEWKERHKITDSNIEERLKEIYKENKKVKKFKKQQNKSYEMPSFNPKLSFEEFYEIAKRRHIGWLIELIYNSGQTLKGFSRTYILSLTTLRRLNKLNCIGHEETWKKIYEALKKEQEK